MSGEKKNSREERGEIKDGVLTITVPKKAPEAVAASKRCRSSRPNHVVKERARLARTRVNGVSPCWSGTNFSPVIAS